MKMERMRQRSPHVIKLQSLVLDMAMKGRRLNTLKGLILPSLVIPRR
jgi:hypothetical protein